MRSYIDLVRMVLETGIRTQPARPGLPATTQVVGPQLKVDLTQGFPLITTREMNFNVVHQELLWFLNGRTDTKWLSDKGIHIWDSWGPNIGPVYGAQWIKDIDALITNLKECPTSRRLMLTSYSPDEPPTKIWPCITQIQFLTDEIQESPWRWVDVIVSQRSCDLMIGCPHDIASMALLTGLVAAECKLLPRNLIFNYGSLHIYQPHIENAAKLLYRDPYMSPKIIIGDCKNSWFDMDLMLADYKHHPKLKFELFV